MIEGERAEHKCSVKIRETTAWEVSQGDSSCNVWRRREEEQNEERSREKNSKGGVFILFLVLFDK